MVLELGSRLSGVTGAGPIEVLAVGTSRRRYRFARFDFEVELKPRDVSFTDRGVTYNGAWAQGGLPGGSGRYVVREEQVHVATCEAAAAWFHDEAATMRWAVNADGVVVGWAVVPDRRQVNVSIYRVFVGDGDSLDCLMERSEGSVTVEGSLVVPPTSDAIP
jgi:hypothetical protein